MTQEEAIIKALEDFGGKACNHDIYERAKKYAHFGGKTPDNTIRWYLQNSKKIRPSEGKRGWWELLSYQQEVSELKTAIAKRDRVIEELRGKTTLTTMFAEVASRYMDALVGFDKEDRKTAREAMKNIMSALKITPNSDLHSRINRFANEPAHTGASVGGDNDGVVVGGNLGVKLSERGEQRLVDGLIKGSQRGIE